MWSTCGGVTTEAERVSTGSVRGGGLHVPREESARMNSWNDAARIVAGIFVSAAMAAYDPPAAGVPQIAMTARRVPRSRAVFVDTVRELRQRRIQEYQRKKRRTSDGRVSPDRHRAAEARHVSTGQTRTHGRKQDALGEGHDPGACGWGNQEVGRVHAAPDDQANQEILFKSQN